MDTFENLVAIRARLRASVAHHRSSVEWFRATDGSFYRTARDRVQADAEPTAVESTATGDIQSVAAPEVGDGAESLPHTEDVSQSWPPSDDVAEVLSDASSAGPVGSDRRRVKSLTTTFTCIESLADARVVTGDVKDVVADDARQSAIDNGKEYVSRALLYPDDWRSEYAATVYCRVRSLAPLLDLFGASLDDEQQSAAVGLLNYAWKRVKAESGSDGIYELGVKNKDVDDTDVELRYPPNAYLTYWGLAALEAANHLNLAVGHLEPHRKIAAIWLEKCLGTQVALHAIDSRRCDPQQIAWAICGLLRSESTLLAERPTPARELVQAGLHVFFARQDPTGTWPRGEPLFHYPAAGNAYCYPFETLAELVGLSLGTTPIAIELRQMLAPYQDQLVRAFDFAMTVRRQLPTSQPAYGWCSEHHPHRRSPESWATAAVYRYMQALRRLVGIWVREHVAEVLKAREAREGLATLRDMGDTWNAHHGSAGVQLASLFVHPINGTVDRSLPDDPDVPPLSDKHACSAIMFGPPGTGKTTLVEAVAGAIGWDFIEITPAHFLDNGVDRVSARADEVFNMLMELDRHVVLFDEIDELIRQRTDEAESLERFFTTTMLPRLSKLWKAKRLLFFVNTNSIEHVDPAIRRSQRFDTALFVLPPSGEKKLRLLGTGPGGPVSVQICNDILTGTSHQESVAPAHAWLAFARYDQLANVKLKIEKGADALAAVQQAGVDAYKSDWQDDKDAEGDTETTDEQARPKAVAKYRKLANFQRRDSSRIRMVKAPAGAEPLDDVEKLDATYWRVLSSDDDLTQWARAKGFTISASAELSAIETSSAASGGNAEPVVGVAAGST